MGIETDAVAAQYDALRAQMGLGNDLLVQTASRSGYGTPVTITNGWLPESLKPPQDGDQNFKVRVAEHSGWETSIMATVSAVIIGTTRYEIKTAPQSPIMEPLVWILTCYPITKNVS